jgi:hypothetical protein
VDITQALTLAGATIVVGILVEAVKRAAAWTETAQDRFLPLLSIALGIGAVLALNSFQVADLQLGIGEAAIMGLLSGASAAGLYDAVSG